LSRSRSGNVTSMHTISTRRAANSVLAAGARLADLKDRLNDLAAIAQATSLTPEHQALYERLRDEEVEARRAYEEAVHRFRFLTSHGVPSARTAT
jgi:hypothetical protein